MKMTFQALVPGFARANIEGLTIQISAVLSSGGGHFIFIVDSFHTKFPPINIGLNRRTLCLLKCIQHAEEVCSQLLSLIFRSNRTNQRPSNWRACFSSEYAHFENFRPPNLKRVYAQYGKLVLEVVFVLQSEGRYFRPPNLRRVLSTENSSSQSSSSTNMKTLLETLLTQQGREAARNSLDSALV